MGLDEMAKSRLAASVLVELVSHPDATPLYWTLLPWTSEPRLSGHPDVDLTDEQARGQVAAWARILDVTVTEVRCSRESAAREGQWFTFVDAVALVRGVRVAVQVIADRTPVQASQDAPAAPGNGAAS